MEAAYTKNDAVVILDPSEVRLIMKALDTLRYSGETMTGSMLVNLAGLSQDWQCMTQDIGSPKEDRITKPDDGYLVIAKAMGMVLPVDYWEISAEDVKRMLIYEACHN